MRPRDRGEPPPDQQVWDREPEGSVRQLLEHREAEEVPQAEQLAKDEDRHERRAVLECHADKAAVAAVDHHLLLWAVEAERVDELRLTPRAEQHRALCLERVHEALAAHLPEPSPPCEIADDGREEERRGHKRRGLDPGQRLLERGNGRQVSRAGWVEAVGVIAKDVLLARRELLVGAPLDRHASDPEAHGFVDVRGDEGAEPPPLTAPRVGGVPPAREPIVGDDDRHPGSDRDLQGEDHHRDCDHGAEDVDGEVEPRDEHVAVDAAGREAGLPPRGCAEGEEGSAEDELAGDHQRTRGEVQVGHAACDPLEKESRHRHEADQGEREEDPPAGLSGYEDRSAHAGLEEPPRALLVAVQQVARQAVGAAVGHKQAGGGKAHVDELGGEVGEGLQEGHEGDADRAQQRAAQHDGAGRGDGTGAGHGPSRPPRGEHQV
mmetsp:Transcript_34806/g.82566  ORF Transcript_34806/g.82566 Transcript_34806/m.82566 type:complete len:435 (-) Transcript_34806:875-2179(-)